MIETEVPGVRWLPPTESFRVYHHGDDHVGIDEYDPATQQMSTHHYFRRADGSYHGGHCRSVTPGRPSST